VSGYGQSFPQTRTISGAIHISPSEGAGPRGAERSFEANVPLMRAPLPDRLAHHMRKLDTPAGRRMVRYVAQSVLTTIFSFVVLGLVYGVFRWWTEIPSVVFANTVATVPSYYLNRHWVWRKGGRSHLMKEVVPFWVISFIGIVLSILAAAAARHIGLKYFPNHHGLRTVLVEAANLFAFGVLWIGKFLIFSRLFRHQHVEATEVIPAVTTDSAATASTSTDGNGSSADDRATTPTDGRAHRHIGRAAEPFIEPAFEEN
jgi:putative flippase GtrA